MKIIYALYRNRNGGKDCMSTPATISSRNPVCRLCGGSHESHYMLRIFRKAGLFNDFVFESL